MIAGPEVDGLALQRVHEPAVQLEILRRDLDLERDLARRLAGLEALELHEVGALLADLAGDLREDPPALDRPAVAPSGKRRARGGDRGIHVRGFAAGDLGDRFPAERIVVVQIPAGAGQGRLPGDEVIPAWLHEI